MFPIKRKIDGFQVNSYSFNGWLTTKQLMEMYPTPEEREKLFLVYEPKEEPMIILSWFLLLMFGVVAFVLFGAVTWFLHSMGLF